MEKHKQIISQLNEFLEDKNSDSCQLDIIIKQLFGEETLTLRFMDFEYYSEIRMEDAKIRKEEDIKLQNFEMATYWKEIEKKCQKYIEFKNGFDFKKSTFLFEDKQLIYFYFGNAKNDEIAKEYFKEKSGTLKLSLINFEK